jgi:uncharacterized protein with HEPN domain
VTYRDRQRLADIQAAIDAIRSHLQRGDLSDGLVFDAVRIRLLEIGEAVKALPAEVLDSQPDIPWTQIARMRDHLAHRYFDTDHAVLQATVDNDVPERERAVQALAETLSAEEQQEEGPQPSRISVWLAVWADRGALLGVRAAHRRPRPTIFIVLTNLFVGWILERCWTSL